MRILAIAYACEPDQGSEPGAGWAWSRMLARLGETWVITRANNRPGIEAAMRSLDLKDRARYVYVDLPRWARFWKRGQRGVRLYYLLWQISALKVARRLQQAQPFDLVWHVTLANVWLGSVGPFVGAPFLYGPVGGGNDSCLDPRIVGMRGAFSEIVRAMAVGLGRYVNPLSRSSWRRAVMILANNGDTVRWLPARVRPKATVFPNVALDDLPSREQARDSRRTAVFAGRLLHWKGGALAVQTMRYLPDWELVIFGIGPDKARMRRLAEELGVANRVTFRGWVSRDDLLKFMSVHADVLLLPSLHDQAPWIVGEALTMGVPAICVDRGGPPALGATCVPMDGLPQTVRALADAVRRSHPGPLPRWDRDSRYAELKRLLQSKGLLEHVEP
jgi:glycosyltransferase involved in cell wall biosynthesis